MAKPELGTKRICPETGRKFYDLNKDPIVSPYTGKEYPLSYFEGTSSNEVLEKEEPEAVEEVDTENENVEIVSLEDADDEASGNDSSSDDENLPDIDGDDDDDVDIDNNDDDDTFLEADDDDDDDVSDIISVGDDDDDS